jgi:rhodanese-related sulfurtransferase
MRPEDRNVLETHLLAQLTDAERELAKIERHRDTLRDLLLKVRRENAQLRDVTRKNSYDRILIEGRVVNLLKGSKRPLPTSRLYWAAKEISPHLPNSTFRSHLHRLKSKGIIDSETHGYWTVAKPAAVPQNDNLATATS